ncbi:hypothetical protein OAI12_02170 [Porticoccaceae bacterium]|nr:hypothetical protein [Porticoccaceae bacterium]
MKSKIIMALSIVLNLVALFYLYSANTTVFAVAESELPLSTVQQKHSNYAQLIEIGLSDTQAKMLILQELKAQDRSQQGVTEYEYWRVNRAQVLAQQIEDVIKDERRLRSRLRVLFGDEVVADHSLQEVFAPSTYQRFLSSGDQIALREHQLRQHKNSIAEELTSGVDELVNAEILTASGVLEYRLRYSPLAARLLGSGVIFSEQNFRESYLALAPIYENSQSHAFDATTLIAQRNKLKQLMGIGDSMKILANLDNRFSPLKAAGKHYNLTEIQLLSAYKIISDSEEEMIEGYFVRQSNPQRGIQMIREAAQHREQRLADYLGDDVGRSLMRAFSSARPDPTTPAGILLSGY